MKLDISVMRQEKNDVYEITKRMRREEEIF